MARTFQRNPKVEGAPVSEETILLDPATSKFFMLNRTCSFIWGQLETPATAETLATELCKSFDDVAMAVALQDVRATLDEMLSLQIVLESDSA